jgi:hypothetical protein
MLPGRPVDAPKNIEDFDSSYAVATLPGYLVSHIDPLISAAGERGALDPLQIRTGRGISVRDRS